MEEKILIKGMHCRSCEILVEEELLKIPGVMKASVYHSKGLAKIISKRSLSPRAIEQAVTAAGYSLGTENITLFSCHPVDYRDLGIALVVALGLYFLAQKIGLFGLGQNITGNLSSLPVVFAIGLTAGVSTCMALVGGLVLGTSTRFAAAHPQAGKWQKFYPHLWFNFGRIISYFIFGAIIGLLGSFLQLSTSVLGILTIVVGLVMLLLGSQLIEIFPILSKISLTIPAGLAKFFGLHQRSGSEYNHKNAVILGGLTFFLPCGFTQAMQLYAMNTGHPWSGALTMGVFALGTTPGLLGVGGLASVAKGRFGKLFFKTAGVVVILLAVFNISNGLNIFGLRSAPQVLSSKVSQQSSPPDPNVTIVNGIQEVRMLQTAGGYTPNLFHIKKGLPVKWIVNSQSPYSCAASLVSSQLGVRLGLKPGENIINFTPQQAGSIHFSCSMGMYNGDFIVTS